MTFGTMRARRVASITWTVALAGTVIRKSYAVVWGRHQAGPGAMASPYAQGLTAEDVEERRLLHESVPELARQQGSALVAAEFDDMKRRLKDVENWEELTRSFRAEPTALEAEAAATKWRGCWKCR